MTHVTDSRVRPLRFRFRPDLACRARDEGGRRCWIVADPLVRRHFLLEEEEYFLATQLDGRRSLAEIGREFEQRWPTYKFSAARFQVFLARLHRDGLLLDDSADLSRVLEHRREQGWLQTWLASPGKLLAFRLPGVNPAKFLDITYPWVRICFTPGALLAAFLVMLWAGWIVLLHPSDLAARLPSLQSWMTPDHVVSVALVLTLTKVMHELGHAYTCRHFGGKCRELGVMFLVFTPCLYCDVSDAWMISGKWRRAAVAAAGMWVECVFAAGCTVVWWHTDSDRLGNWCLLFMSVSGISTLVFNGNPLLRYDGYFILSDLSGAPNLWQRSRAVARDLWARWCLGIRRRSDEIAGERAPGWLAFYAIISEAYRVTVTWACLIFVWRLFESWHLERVGWLAAIVSGGGAVLPACALAYQRLSDPGWRREVKRSRLGLTISLGLAAAVIFVIVPLPSRVRGRAVLQVEDATPLYVTAPGFLQRVRPSGVSLRSGDVVAVLSNPECERERTRWNGEVAVHQARVNYLESVRGEDPQAASLLPAALEALEGARQLAVQREEEVARLSLAASVAGEWLAAPAVTPENQPREGSQTDRVLPSWSGSPLDPKNLGAFLETGTLLGWVGDTRRMEAVVYLAESDVERVEKGQSVVLRFAAWPGRRFEGVVREVSSSETDEVPRELARADSTDWRLDSQGTPRFTETTYRASVRLQSLDAAFLHHVRGEAKILVAPESLSARLRRALRKSFAWMP